MIRHADVRTAWLLLAAMIAAGLGGCRPSPRPSESSGAVSPAPSAAATGALILTDDFEGELAPFWLPGDYGSGRYAPGAVRITCERARRGRSCVEITVREGDVEQRGDSGQLNERAELDSGKHPLLGKEAWYRFSFLIPGDFPIADVRLVIAQWKQSRVAGSPLAALRFRAGRLYLTVRDPLGHRDAMREYPMPDPGRERWNDVVVRIRFSTGNDGEVEVWHDGRRVAEHHGATAWAEGQNNFYNKFGLYRDRWPAPMTIYFDDYAAGESSAAAGDGIASGG